MKKNFSCYTLVYLGILTLFLIQSVSAVNIYKINSNVSINHPIRINGAIAPNAICNISVFNPEGDIIIDFLQMTSGSAIHNFTVIDSKNNLVGFYDYCITCTDSGLNQSSCFQYEITFTGREKAETGFIVVFSLIFISISVLLLYFFLHSIAKGGKFEYDIKDLSISWGFLFGLLAMFLIFDNYWADVLIRDIIVWIISIASITNGFIPLVLFIVSIIFGSLKNQQIPDIFVRRKRR